MAGHLDTLVGANARHLCSPGFRVDHRAAFGKMTHLVGRIRPANPVDLAFAVDFWRMTSELLRQDRLRLGPLAHWREGGLTGIPDGLLELKKGRVSAGKLVYTIEDDS